MGGIYRHYTADRTLVGTYPGEGKANSITALPPALRLAIKPGDTVEFLKPNSTGISEVEKTWNVVTELLDSDC